MIKRCKRGHEYTPGKGCKECKLVASREAYARLKETDPEKHRAIVDRVLANDKRNREDPEKRKRVNEIHNKSRRKRYAENPVFRENLIRLKLAHRAKMRAASPEYRERERVRSRESAARVREREREAKKARKREHAEMLLRKAKILAHQEKMGIIRKGF